MSLERKCCWEIDNLEFPPPFLVINNILMIFQTPFSPFNSVVIFNLHQTTQINLTHSNKNARIAIFIYSLCSFFCYGDTYLRY